MLGKSNYPRNTGDGGLGWIYQAGQKAGSANHKEAPSAAANAQDIIKQIQPYHCRADCPLRHLGRYPDF